MRVVVLGEVEILLFLHLNVEASILSLDRKLCEVQVLHSKFEFYCRITYSASRRWDWLRGWPNIWGRASTGLRHHWALTILIEVILIVLVGSWPI